MKFLVVLAFLAASTLALQRDSEFMTAFPESWYEEEAAKALTDDDIKMPHFINADEEFASDFASDFTADPQNVIQVAKKLGATIFVKACHLTGLIDTFSNTNNITAFIPSNRAFATLPKDVYFYFLRHPDRLRDLLKFHVVTGEFLIENLVDDQVLNTLLGNLTIRYDLYNHTKSNWTTKVIQGSRISHDSINNHASNGIVQMIDEVMLRVSVVDSYTIISKSTHFSTLYNGLIVAGLDQGLKTGSQTLFAPTERAFKKLPPGVWEALLKDKAALTDVLDLHFANTAYFARGFRDEDVIPSLNKAQSLTIRVRRDKAAEDETVDRPHPRFEVDVNDARIVFFDGATTTGVIQVIDKVLIPPKVMERLSLKL